MKELPGMFSSGTAGWSGWPKAWVKPELQNASPRQLQVLTSAGSGGSLDHQEGLPALLDQRQVGRPRAYALVLGGLAALALVIAGVGLFGTLSYATARRTPEIGVRIALGAERQCDDAQSGSADPLSGA